MRNFLSKIVLILLCLFLFPASNLAIEEDGEAVPDVKKGEVLKDKIITLDETIDGDTTTDVEFDDDDNLDFRLFTEKTFAKKKSVKFDNSFIDEISGELRFQGIK